MQRILFTIMLSLLSGALFAADSLYCPQNHAYVKIGMSVEQVISACGQPIGKQESNEPVYVRIPVQQLLFFYQSPDEDIPQVLSYNIRANTEFTLDRGGTGVSLQVDVVDNKVQSIILNGSGKNAISICGDASIKAGDPVSKVYFACGSPSAVNNTFMRKPVPSVSKPQVWTYKPTPYAPSVSLTFVDGTLQSIN